MFSSKTSFKEANIGIHFAALSILASSTSMTLPTSRMAALAFKVPKVAICATLSCPYF